MERNTGPGLDVVEKIAAEHRGRVTVESSSRPSCFTVMLPGAFRPLTMRPSESE